MAAYRGHMTRVKKELEFLKKRAVEAAGKLVNDDTVTNLKKQIDWFQHEAIELDKHLDKQKRDFQIMKTKQKNTIDDNKFLKTQVKEAMKHNKLLEVAMTKTTAQTSALEKFLKKNRKITR